MTLRRLGNLLDNYKVGQDPSVPVSYYSGQTSIIGQGTVQDVGDTRASVQVSGVTVVVLMATDEPLRAGQKVWVSRTAGGGYVCHGSVK